MGAGWRRVRIANHGWERAWRHRWWQRVGAHLGRRGNIPAKQITHPGAHTVHGIAQQTGGFFVHKPVAAVQGVGAEGLLQKVAHHGQRAVGALAPVIAAQGDAPIVEAHPRTRHHTRVQGNEPAVGVVLRGAGFARQVGPQAVAAAQGGAGAPVDGAAHGVAQGLCGLQGHGLLGRGRRKGLQHLAVAVFNAGDEDGLDVAACVGDGAVGSDHFAQRDRAGAQRQRWHLFQLALAHAHGAGQVGHTGRAHLLHDLGGDGVLGKRQAVGQRHGGVAGRTAISGAPHLVAAQRNLYRLVHQLVRRQRPLHEGHPIHKRLEGGARLAAGSLHMVERVGSKVAAAHPGQHMAGDGVHGHEARLHAGFFLLQRGHEAGVGQQGFQHFIRRLALGHRLAVLRGFAHQRMHQLALGVPAVAGRPGVVGNALQLAALPCHGLVGHGLQARVDGGAHDEAIGMQAVAIGIGPGDELLAQLLRKVRGQAHGFGLAFKVNAQRALLQGRQLGLFQLAALDHLRQHDVAPRLRALGLGHGVVVGRALEHANQRGTFQQVELVGRLVEIRARGHLDAVGVVQKRHGVEVGLQDFILGVRPLDLEGGDGFLELAGDGARAANFFREQVARQLLRDGGAALRIAAQRVHHRRRSAPEVHARVLVKAVVLRGDEGVDHMGRDAVQRHPLAVGPAVLGQHLTVHRQKLRGPLGLGFGDVGNRRGERDEQQRVHRQQRWQGQHQQQPGAPAAGLQAPPKGGHSAQGLQHRARPSHQARAQSGEKTEHGFSSARAGAAQ